MDVNKAFSEAAAFRTHHQPVSEDRQLGNDRIEKRLTRYSESEISQHGSPNGGHPNFYLYQSGDQVPDRSVPEQFTPSLDESDLYQYDAVGNSGERVKRFEGTMLDFPAVHDFHHAEGHPSPSLHATKEGNHVNGFFDIERHVLGPNVLPPVDFGGSEAVFARSGTQDFQDEIFKRSAQHLGF